MTKVKYRLEKLINGQWYEEGTYEEGYWIKHLVYAAFNLAHYAEDIRVIVIEGD